MVVGNGQSLWKERYKWRLRRMHPDHPSIAEAEMSTEKVKLLKSRRSLGGMEVKGHQVRKQKEEDRLWI